MGLFFKILEQQNLKKFLWNRMVLKAFLWNNGYLKELVAKSIC
jgi:phage-related protein